MRQLLLRTAWRRAKSPCVTKTSKLRYLKFQQRYVANDWLHESGARWQRRIPTNYSIIIISSSQWRRLHEARGARAPPPTFTNGWPQGGTVSRRTTNKKQNTLYWPSQKCSPKRIIALLDRDLRIAFFRSNQISNRIGRPIRFRIESSNRIGRIYHASRNTA